MNIIYPGGDCNQDCYWSEELWKRRKEAEKRRNSICAIKQVRTPGFREAIIHTHPKNVHLAPLVKDCSWHCGKPVWGICSTLFPQLFFPAVQTAKQTPVDRESLWAKQGRSWYLKNDLLWTEVVKGAEIQVRTQSASPTPTILEDST